MLALCTSQHSNLGFGSCAWKFPTKCNERGEWEDKPFILPHFLSFCDCYQGESLAQTKIKCTTTTRYNGYVSKKEHTGQTGHTQYAHTITVMRSDLLV